MTSKGLFPLSFISLAVFVVCSGCSSSGSGSGSGGGNVTPTPAISSITPTSVSAGASAQTITVMGSGFVSGSVIEVGGVAEVTTYGSSTELTATVPAAQLATGMQLAVVVSNGTTTSSAATPVNLVVDNPVPTIAYVSPSTELVGSSSTVVTVTGTGFVSSTAIDINGTARPTNYTSATQVSVTVSAADLTAAGTLSVTAINPAPGGGNSTRIAFVVANPVAQLLSISPTTVTQGTASTITLSGSGFNAASVGLWNGSARPTAFVSNTSLQVSLTASDVQTAGTGLLAIINPAPGGNTTSSVQLSIVPVAPVVSSVTPSSVLVGANGSSPLAVTMYGSSFAANATLTINGSALAIVSQNATSISTAIPPSYLAQAGKLELVVTNPGPVAAASGSVYVQCGRSPHHLDSVSRIGANWKPHFGGPGNW